jgi:hypothetical protein
MPIDGLPPQLWGRDLRHALLALLLSHPQTWTPASLLAALEAGGLVVVGDQPGKVVADALGHEVVRGRAVRVGRGLYRAGPVAERTSRRLRARWRARRLPNLEP